MRSPSIFSLIAVELGLTTDTIYAHLFSSIEIDRDRTNLVTTENAPIDFLNFTIKATRPNLKTKHNHRLDLNCIRHSNNILNKPGCIRENHDWYF